MADNISWKVLLGDNRDTIKTLEDNSVQTVISSPPYFGLRRYSDSADEIGIEETPEDYIKNLCDVFDDIHSKLKDDGTLWINLGDTYASNVKEGIKKFGSKNFQEGRPGRQNVKQPGRKLTGNLKQKDLIGIPWMFAFEMRSRGWYLRQDILWSKLNPMPASVEDRCTTSHEYIFLLSKTSDYYFDYKSIREKSDTPLKEKKKEKEASNTFSFGDLTDEKIDTTIEDNKSPGHYFGAKNPVGTNRQDVGNVWEPDGTRRKRSVWEVPVSCGEAIGIQHFATYPKKLIEPCILAGSKPGDIVLDPFNGSGTTGVVAMEYGRSYIGCELNKDYEKIYNSRLKEAFRAYNLSQGIIIDDEK